MSGRLSDQAERARHYGSRLGVSGELLAMTIAGVVALAVIIAAVVALPRTKTQVAANQSNGQPVTGSVGTGNNVSGSPGAGSVSTGHGSTGGGATTIGSRTPVSSTHIGGSAAAPPGVNAQGVTKDEILVGAAYDKHAGALNSAYGFAGVGQIDQKAAFEHLRDYINTHGGIGGRKIKIVWYVADQLSGKSADTVAQESCTTWTQQSHVFAAFSGGYDTLDACLSKAGVVEVTSGITVSDTATLRKYPYLVELDAAAIDRLAQFYVDQLALTDYYKRGRSDAIGVKGPFKLGLVTYDYPSFRLATEVYKKQLAKHGLNVTDVAYVHLPLQNQELAQEVADIRSAVLKFKSDNVTHVNFLSTGNGFEQLTFWQQSDDQNYYPRYGVTSNDDAQSLSVTFDEAQSSHKPGSASARTFVDAQGVGYLPLVDVPRADYTGSAESPALRQCKSILSYETYDDASRNKESIAALLCDRFFYLKAVLEKGGQIVNQRTYLNGVANVGSVPSAFTFDMGTKADRHDGMNAIKDNAYLTSCHCFRYTSGLKKV